jgi:uncharacterized protein
MNDESRRARAHRTLDRALELLLAHDMTGFAALWAPDGTAEFPFAPPGSPTRLEGRDAVAAYVDGYDSVLDLREVTDQTRHDTADPDTVIVELGMSGVVVATGEPYAVRYIQVVTVGDAGVTAYRDYWNPAAMAELFGAAGLAGVSS